MTGPGLSIDARVAKWQGHVGASNLPYAAVESGHVAGGIVSVMQAILAEQAGLAALSTIADLSLACNNGTGEHSVLP